MPFTFDGQLTRAVGSLAQFSLRREDRCSPWYPRLTEAMCLFQEGAWLFVAVAIPLAINPWGIQLFDLPKIALLRMVATSMALLWLWQWLAGGLSPYNRKARMHWLDPRLWAGILGLVLVAATLTSLDPGLSFWGSYTRQEGLYTLLSYLVLFALVATQLDSRAQAERLLLAIALGSVLIIAYGLVQWTNLDPIVWQTADKSRVISTLGRSNFVGSYLVITIPIIFAACLQSRHPVLRAGLAIELMASLVVLAVAQARSAWLGAGVAWMVLVAVAVMRRGGWRVLLCYAVLAGAALAVFGTAYLGTLVLTGKSTMGDVLRFPELAGSPAARLVTWQATLGLIKERPLLGFGPDSFALAFHHVFPPQLVFYQGRDFVSDRAHNILLQQAVTAGLVGLVSYVVLVATIFVTLARMVNSAKGRDRIVAAAIIAALTGHLTDMLFSFDVASTSVVFWIVIGAGVGLARTVNGRGSSNIGEAISSTPRCRPNRLPLSIGMLFSALAIGLGTNLAPLVADVYSGLAHRSEVPLPLRIEQAKRAVAIWPLEPSHRALLGTLYFEQAQSNAGFRRSLDMAELELVGAVSMRQLDPLLWSILADVRAYRAISTGDLWALKGAELAFQKAIELAPTKATLHAAYGAFEFSAGRLDQAVLGLEQAVALDPTDARAWRYLAEAYRALGRASEADVASATASALVAATATNTGQSMR